MANEVKVEVITSLDHLEFLAPSWRQLESHPNTVLKHFSLVCKLRECVESPFVLVASECGRTRAIMVGRLERVVIAPSIGYLRPVKITASALVILHGGLLGEINKDIAKAFVVTLEHCRRAAGVDLIRFSFLEESSPVVPALKELYPPRCFDDKVPWNLHWEMKLHSEPGFLLKRMKSTHRSSIRRYERRLAEKYPSGIKWLWLKQIDDIDDVCERMEPVAANSYQRALGAGFVDNQEYRERFKSFAKAGILRIQLLEIDGNIRAFWIGVLMRGVFYSSDTAYDQSLRDYSVGNLVFLRLVDSLVAEGASRFDFGLGDAIYKSRFGDRSWRERSYDFFAPTIKGYSLEAVTFASRLVDNVGRRFVASFGVFNSLKTAWRRRLAGKK